MGNGNRVEMFIALCALVSSLVAVFIAWDQGRVMRAQQHGEVYPVLQVDGTNSNTAEFSKIGITISNSGVGPALIESVIMEIDGERVTALPDALAALPRPTYDSSSGLAGRALAPGEKIDAITLTWTSDRVTPAQIGRVALESEKWVLKVCYCSVFGRCWQTIRIGTGRAQRVKACKAEDTDIFAQYALRNFSPAPAIVPTADGATD